MNTQPICEWSGFISATNSLPVLWEQHSDNGSHMGVDGQASRLPVKCWN